MSRVNKKRKTLGEDNPSNAKKEKLQDVDGDCPVCCSHFTKDLRSPIKCPTQKCDFTACKQCVMRYLSEDTYDRAHCMSCKEPWLDDFVMDSCTKSFWTGPFKKHILRLVMDRERNLLPDTMPFVGTWKRIRSLKATLNDLRDERKVLFEIKRRHQLCHRRKKFPQEGNVQELRFRIYRVYKDIREAENTFQIMVRAQEEGQDVVGMADKDEGESKSDEKPEPLVHCPFEECRGFLNRQRHCDLCDRWVCGKCHKEKKALSDEAHECKEEDVASVKFIQKDAKPCPGCKAPIHKISGCYMMFCTSCHTAFDWKDLKILNPSNVHNPHMIEWMRNGGGGRIGLNRHGYDIYQNIRVYIFGIKERPLSDFVSQLLWDLYRSSNAARSRIQLPSVTTNDFRKARLDYMCGYIDEEKWKKRVAHLNRKMEVQTHENNLFEVYHIGMSNIFNCRLSEKVPLKDLLIEVKAIRDFFIGQVNTLRERGSLPETSSNIQDVYSDRFIQRHMLHIEECMSGGRTF